MRYVVAVMKIEVFRQLMQCSSNASLAAGAGRSEGRPLPLSNPYQPGNRHFGIVNIKEGGSVRNLFFGCFAMLLVFGNLSYAEVPEPGSSEGWIRVMEDKKDGSVHSVKPIIGSRSGNLATGIWRVDFDEARDDKNGRRMDRREIALLIDCDQHLVQYQELRVYLDGAIVETQPAREGAQALVVKPVANSPASELVSQACK